jgi:Protein of unknown function (DUF3455)
VERIAIDCGGLDMKRSIRPHRLLLAGIVVALAAWPLAQLAYAGPEAPPVPSRIAVGDGHKPLLIGHATGVQIYRCNATGSSLSWGFVAPRAELYSDNGQLLTTHFAGPTWQARDGSKAIGQRVDGVTVDSDAIPWLLLSATSQAGPDGDRLAGTTFIQRIATTGGIAPLPGTCDESTVGTISEVPYTADYVFWKATGA